MAVSDVTRFKGHPSLCKKIAGHMYAVCHITTASRLLWTHAQRASMLYFADVFYIFFIPALVGQTAERIFTKLSHVVDIRHHL